MISRRRLRWVRGTPTRRGHFARGEETPDVEASLWTGGWPWHFTLGWNIEWHPREATCDIELGPWGVSLWWARGRL